PEGFQNQIWDARTFEDGVEFMYVSADGEENYPGKLTVRALYTWSSDNTLTLRMYATTDAPTVINLTNHAYFNLRGHDSGTSLDHVLRLNATKYVPTDETLVPYGRIDDVEGTPMDFTSAHTLGLYASEDFPALKNGKGYDSSWVIDGWERGKLSLAAELSEPSSKRKLTIYTDQPIVHVYNGNWISGSPKGKGGYEYHDYDTVSIECQDFPDAPNHSDFPCVVLSPGDMYARTIVFNFSTVL
ncbi:MAG: galactose mutarotase, partial [Muribaculaceae bacterium]|nr:galactose mutarotase [Muribaculaceae bacterium]